MTGKHYFNALTVPLLFFPIHFFFSLNMTHSEFYLEDAVPVSFYNTVRADHRPGSYPPTIGGHRLCHFCWSFLDFSKGGTESQLTYEDYPGTIEDFQIAYKKELPRYSANYKPVLHNFPNDRYLLKRRVPVNRHWVTTSQLPASDQMINREFFTLFSGSLDTLIGKNIYIGFTGRIESPSVPFQAWIVAEARDSTGKAICYEKLSLNWLRPEWKGEKSFLMNGLQVAKLPSSVKNLLVYLWNSNEVLFRVPEGKIEIFVIN
jgi:hypothetical protein